MSDDPAKPLGLDFDARAWASLTGVARGWVQPAGTTFLLACLRCQPKLYIQFTHHWMSDPPEGAVEQIVEQRFADEAQAKWCSHWAEYARVRVLPDWIEAARTRALDLAAQQAREIPRQDAPEPDLDT